MRALLVLCAGCQVTGTWHCASDDQCQLEGKAGYCEATSFCSFDDGTCDTRRKYDDRSAGELSGACVTGIVTGRYVSRYAINDSAYAPQLVETAGMPATLSVKLADGTTPAIHTVGQMFSFGDPGGLPYDITANGTTFQARAGHVELAATSLGQPDRPMVSTSTPIHFQYQPNPSGQDFVASTGVWSNTDLQNSAGFVNLDWNAASFLGSLRALLDMTQNDRLYFYKLTTTAGIGTITAVDAMSFSQSNGGTTTLPMVPLSQVQADQCKHVVVPAMDEHQRLGGTTPMSWDWSLIAYPLPGLGSIGGIPVVVQASSTTPANFQTAPSGQTFHNPFVGTTVVARMNVNVASQVSAPGASSAAVIVHGTQVHTPPGAATSCADTMTTRPKVSIPTGASVAGIALDATDKMITLDRSKRVTISWTAPTAELFQLLIVHTDIDPNDGSTTLTTVAQIRTASPSVEIDQALVPAGSYVLEIEAFLGWPHASDADFISRALPFENTTAVSSTFVIAN